MLTAAQRGDTWDPELHLPRLGSVTMLLSLPPRRALCDGSAKGQHAVAGWGNAREVPSCVYGNIYDVWLWT